MILSQDILGLVAVELTTIRDIIRFTSAAKSLRQAAWRHVKIIISSHSVPANFIVHFPHLSHLDIPRLTASSPTEAAETALFLCRNGLPRLPILQGTHLASKRYL